MTINLLITRSTFSNYLEHFICHLREHSGYQVFSCHVYPSSAYFVSPAQHSWGYWWIMGSKDCQRQHYFGFHKDIKEWQTKYIS